MKLEQDTSCPIARGRRLSAFALIAMVMLGTPSARAAQVIVHEYAIVYGHGGDRELKLDLARPEGKGPFPAIVFIHGGGWSGGNRQAYHEAVQDAALRGYVAVTVSYRLTEPDSEGKAKFPFPAQVHDVKCAVRWLRAHAAKYGVDPKRIGATGGSAGGHLALMLGASEKVAELEGDGGHADQSSRVQAVVNYYGPTDMTGLYAAGEALPPIVGPFLGGGPNEVGDRYRAASPVTYVSRKTPPILTLHGTEDRVVPIAQARLLDKRMKKVGALHTLVPLEGQGHGFQGDARARARQLMYRFFDEYLDLGQARPVLADEFRDQLVDGWSWVREDPKGWRVKDGELQIRIQPGNMWGGANNARNVLVRDAPDPALGPLVVQVLVTHEPTEQWEQAGIMWYGDDGHMVKIIREQVDGEPWLVMGREENDRTQTLAKLPLETAWVHLRLRIEGKRITGEYRPKGEALWHRAGACDTPVKGRPKISLQAYNGPADAEHWARFKAFRARRLPTTTPSP